MTSNILANPLLLDAQVKARSLPKVPGVKEIHLVLHSTSFLGGHSIGEHVSRRSILQHLDKAAWKRDIDLDDLVLVLSRSSQGISIVVCDISKQNVARSCFVKS